MEDIHLSVRYLAEFLLRSGSIDSRFSGVNAGVIGSRLHRKLQKQAGKSYKAEVSLSASIPCDAFMYHLSGRADGVISTNDGIVVDEIKTLSLPLEHVEENHNPAHWAQACIYAHILCAQNSYSSIAVQLTYCNIETEETKSFLRDYTATELEAFVQNLLSEYNKWALLSLEWKKKRNTSLQSLQFPFPEYRNGQRNLAIACYQTYKDKGRLYCSAPTGTGKTISTLFPAIKAMGEGMGESIFYLTAKTITRQAAEDALALLGKNQPLHLRSITLTAKDKICFLEERACLPEVCPYANGYFDRINNALYSILKTKNSFSREKLLSLAQKHTLCPYELSLDLSLWCDCIIGDYNYLFDPVVHLQRFFEGEGGEYLFLVDEAHNLVNRSREMYSAQLDKNAFYTFKKALPKSEKSMHKALGEVNTCFVDLRKQCEEAESTVLKLETPPPAFEKALRNLVARTEVFLENNRNSPYEEELLPLYFDTLFYLRILEGYGAHYITLLHHSWHNISIRLFCMDPSSYLAQSLSLGRASVLFSATLQPLAYYRDTLGGNEQSKLYQVESPFSQQRLGLYIADGISTKYAQRQNSLPSIAALLAQMVQAKTGNYIAYFPSYQYMRQAHEAFTQQYPDHKTLLQTTDMSEAEREEFLLHFAPSPQESLLAFCVMGGIFSEGVDLPGSQLIGAAVVGVGLPQIGPEPDALKEYYDQQNGCGFEYSYQFPGMNKVLQAAGRVIRTEQDKGVVLLIDSRYTTPRYQAMFPPHWQHWQKITLQNASTALTSFWACPPE